MSISMTTAVQLVAVCAGNQNLEKAHEYAAEFHEAMARALWYSREIDEHTVLSRTARSIAAGIVWQSQIPALEKSYQTALGRAAAALQLMPPAWAAILNTSAVEKK